ncbi:MAG TPA: hypothetical protein PKK96_16035 [Anaerolineales bacterium]|nr:hypothetical protein [Anaerolineales bacterium]HNQ94742.1 hypothetical protein [Anaerolineales bacterium]HNS62508.1 hypothetical protein [Anaerolineales bacterium]
MDILQVRKQLHQRIDSLPDDVIAQVADFTLFIMVKNQISPLYEEWEVNQWQNFALERFFHEEDEVEYSISDAKEVYKTS